MRAQGKLVNGVAQLLVTLLSFGFFASGCGMDNSNTDLGVTTQAGGVPKDVVAIIRAIDAGDVSELKKLLEGGAVPTPNGSQLSPMHAAITHFRDGQLVCNAAALKLLLDYKADPDFVDQDSGFSALEDALAMGDIECAKQLRRAGARLDQHGHSGQSLLQFAAKGAVRTGEIGILKLVLSWGVDPNVRGYAGQTALHEAVWSSNLRDGQLSAPVIAELLRSGADPCIANERGQTALDLVTNLNSPDSVRQLLSEASRSCPTT